MISFKSIVGKHLLLGITGYDESGNELYKFQLHGTIIYAKRGDMISVKVESDPVSQQVTLGGDKAYSIPPDLTCIKKADKGIYTLKTGEKVVDPDLLASWSVTMPID